MKITYMTCIQQTIIDFLPPIPANVAAKVATFVSAEFAISESLDNRDPFPGVRSILEDNIPPVVPIVSLAMLALLLIDADRRWMEAWASR